METIRATVEGFVDELSHYQRVLIWHQTRASCNWMGDDKERYFADVRDAVVQLIIDDHFCGRAEKWTNARIRAYIDRLQS